MKHLIKLSILIAGISLAVTVNAQDALTSFKAKVDFHCPGGQSRISTALDELDGVENIVVDLETKIVSLNYNPEVLSKEDIIKKIEDAGHYTEFSDRSKPIKSACSHGNKEHHHEHDHD